MRLDPARARIGSVPLLTSNRRFGDVVLHDGVPTGERLLHGEPLPVCDELELLVQSPYSTVHAEVNIAAGEAFEDLDDPAHPYDLHIQNWTATLRRFSREEREGCAHRGGAAGRSDRPIRQCGAHGRGRTGVPERLDQHARGTRRAEPSPGRTGHHGYSLSRPGRLGQKRGDHHALEFTGGPA
ncbi:hypothetical protein [Deinococcus sonorensis]|uniref:Uncharacterized protein n=1 Tax=Deinococcus sonorensis TaxID=309891 RepID=A0ABV8YCH3_9DEIO